MNAITKRAAVAPSRHTDGSSAANGSAPFLGNLTGIPSVTALMAAVLAARDEAGSPDRTLEACRQEGFRRINVYKSALEELVLAKPSDSVAGCISQLLLLSTRIDEVLSIDSNEERERAGERRNEQLQVTIFRLVRLLQLDPAAVGADMYLPLEVLLLDGYVPAWTQQVAEASQ